MRTARRLAVAALVAALGGCAGFKDYVHGGEPNLTIRSQLQSSFWRKVGAMVHLFAVSGSCETEYLGTVHLERPELRLAVAPRQRTYLKFVFMTEPRFGNTTTNTPYAVLLTPKPGVRYTADASYADAMYHVTLTANGVELERELGPCAGVATEP